MATDRIEDELDKETPPPEIRREAPDVPDELLAQVEADTARSLPEDQLAPEEPMAVTTTARRPKRLKSWKFWLGLVVVLTAGAAITWLITPTRLWLVRAAGLTTTLTVYSTAAAPAGQAAAVLKNTNVNINGKGYKTDAQGIVRVPVAYGAVDLTLSKAGYDTVIRHFTLDFDPFFYKLGGRQADDALRRQTIALKNVGLNVTFTAKDWLTGQPITSGQFSVGDVVAKPNDQGLVGFTIPASDAKTVAVNAAFGGAYLDTTLQVSPGTSSLQTFVPGGVHYFVSKRSGAYGVYRSDLDGGHTEEFLPLAAAETSVLTVSASPGGKYLAMVSTREGARNSRGITQPKLYIIETATKKMTTFDTADAFKLQDWAADSLVYIKVSDGQQHLMAADATTTAPATLKTGKSIANVFVNARKVVFTVADPAVENSPQLYMTAGGGGAPVSLGNQVQQVTQTDPEVIAFRTADNLWHAYNINTARAYDTSAPQSTNRRFLNATSQNGQTRLYIDKVDGLPALFARSVAGGQDTQLLVSGGVQAPIRWAGNTVLFCKIDAAGSADYAIAPSGGPTKKISNVSVEKTEEMGVN